jgi:aspartate/glutamate racemase
MIAEAVYQKRKKAVKEIMKCVKLNDEEKEAIDRWMFGDMSTDDLSNEVSKDVFEKLQDL